MNQSEHLYQETQTLERQVRERDEEIARLKRLHEGIDEDAGVHSMSDMDVYTVWKLGLAAYLGLSAFGGKLLYLPRQEE